MGRQWVDIGDVSEKGWVWLDFFLYSSVLHTMQLKLRDILEGGFTHTLRLCKKKDLVLGTLLAPD